MHAFRRSLIGISLLIVLLGPSATGIHADDELLGRVGTYVRQLQERLAVVIGDETYQQDVWERTPGRAPQRHVATRGIRSEVLFMSLPGQGAWGSLLSVRNVLFVNGRSIRDSKGRLDRILTSATLDHIAQLRQLQAESARFDVGRMWRTTGDPTLVIRFLLPENHARFVFGDPQRERVDGVDAVKLTFSEQQYPTAIDFDGRDALSKGSVWVRPEDGAVVRTNLQLTTPASMEVTVTVTFALDARLALWVPHRMDETYSDARQETRCFATYSNFRRFETSGRIIK